jgi:non-heme chloroperoxidase
MHPFRASDGALLAYRTFGEGPRTVLPVHGWMASGRVWDALCSELTEVRLIVPDLRGAGASAAVTSAITLERMARDVAELMCAQDEPVDLVGHSMGGQIAMLAALYAPERVRSLALLTPVPPDGLTLPAEVAESFRGAGGKRAALNEILLAATRQLSEADRQMLVEDALQIAPSCIAEGFDAWSSARFAERVGAIAHETLVLATDDPFLPSALLDQRIVQRISTARLTYLAGAGHYPQVESPRETALQLRMFWKSIP